MELGLPPLGASLGSDPNFPRADSGVQAPQDLGAACGLDAGTGLENINEMVGFADSRDLLDDKTTTLKDTPKL